MTQGEKLLGAAQVAGHLGVCVRTLRRWVRSGTFPAPERVWDGRWHVRWPAAQVAEWRRGLMDAPSDPARKLQWRL